MHRKLKLQYDGYHFSRDSEGVYNPFSLLKSFQQRDLGSFWFESGTPSFLIKQMQHFRTDITAMDDIEVPSTAFDRPTEAMTTALPLLYQSGYLTIKDYERESQLYKLSIPNQEVRVGFADGLLPTYIGLEGFEVQTGFALKFWRALKAKDLDLALREMQSYLASLPYIEGFKKKLEDVSAEANDLIDGMLQLDPKNRLTEDEILKHPWIVNINLNHRNKLNLFTDAEKILLSKFNVDYLTSEKAELIENFTLKNLETNKESRDEGNTKSLIFAPYN